MNAYRCIPSWRNLAIGAVAFNVGVGVSYNYRHGGSSSASKTTSGGDHKSASWVPPVFPVAKAESASHHPPPAGPAAGDGREKLVVLGSGWGAVALLKNIDPALYEVIVVSPRNYFLNTPLLPGVTVGTVEARSLTQPIRALLPGTPGQARFYEAAATAVDPKRRTVRCVDESEVTAGTGAFTLEYDKLVVAVGAPCNTFGTPGVREHTTFLKEVTDAIAIRSRITDLMETASLPGVSEEEQRRMLSILVVGGGPTGVEFAGEMHDFVKDDLPRLYPEIGDKLSITLVQSPDHILNTYDERISKYAEEKFARDGIKVLTNRRVTSVKANQATVMDKKTKQVDVIPFGVCVWSTGLGCLPITAAIQAAAGQPKRRALAVDKYLHVRGVENGTMYALGDCADVKAKAVQGAELVDDAQALFKKADVDKSGTLDAGEIMGILQTLEKTYPQIKVLTSGGGDGYLPRLLERFDEDKNGTLDIKEFTCAMAHADSRLSSHPATAQVANQQGEYLARELNAAALARKSGEAATREPKPFVYTHLGQFASLGSEQAAMQLPGDVVSSGFGSMMLWYGVYFSNCVSWRNKFLVAGDWFKKTVWGRDSSRV